MREAFERRTSILNRDSAADHQLISATYLIIFPISFVQMLSKSPLTPSMLESLATTSHCQDIAKSSAWVYCIMQTEL